MFSISAGWTWSWIVSYTGIGNDDANLACTLACFGEHLPGVPSVGLLIFTEAAIVRLLVLEGFYLAFMHVQFEANRYALFPKGEWTKCRVCCERSVRCGPLLVMGS